MKSFYGKLKGWAKFWFWMIVLALVINFFQLVDYTFQKKGWDYLMNNKEISLLTKIVFPAPSIIFENDHVGFMMSTIAYYPHAKKDYGGFKSFPEYWQHYKAINTWPQRIGTGLGYLMAICVLVIIEWLYVIFWQFAIKFLIWELFIKEFIWWFCLKGFVWEFLVKDIIWGVFLSGRWLK
ncbi:MAG TPA: hypothetical protein PLQ44_01685 [Candidatus Paceibacterota bacterium]|nr:hypothetical protein [Candidatus Paceibacterota bacterium]HPT40297.1 hypothetical protein [Candidatus Paceibacterota bacterium]